MKRAPTPPPLQTVPGGFLAVLEGIDGAGKSTLVTAMAEYCRTHELACVVSREPTSGPWGQQLRRSATTGRLPLAEEIELFRRDRLEHVAGVIAPGLRLGKVVILDRYYFSTAAYQGARGADPAGIIQSNEEFAPAPDLLLLLDVDPAAGLGRVRARGDVPDEFEREQELSRARKIFQGIRHPNLFQVDATRPQAEVEARALEVFATALKVRLS